MQEGLNKGGDAQQSRHPYAADTPLQIALAARDEFLARHPHLQDFQTEIDRILDNSGNRQGRLAVLGTLMQAKLLDMQKELYKLTEILRDAASTAS
jgi:hypothetical protein